MEVDWKKCTSNKDECSLEKVIKKSWFKILGERHKERTLAFNVKPLLNQKQVRKCLPWAEEKKNRSVVQSPLFRWKSILHFIWKFSLEEEQRGAESEVFEVHCEVPAFGRILRTLNFHLLKSFIYGDVDFLFQLDVACCQSDRTTTKWFAVHDITVLGQPSRLAWTQQRIYEILPRGSRPPKILTLWRPLKTNLGFGNTSAVPQADRLHAMKH